MTPAADNNTAIPRRRLAALVKLCRPTQWVKNVFVLSPLFFSGSITDPVRIAAAVWGVMAFCLLSSAVYCINDLLDAEADRRHPRKKNRPIAAGTVSEFSAVALAVALFVVAGGIGYRLSGGFLALMAAYFCNSLAYTVILKRRAIVDVLSIAIGFVLRIVAGCAAIGVEPTSWILVCGFSLAMLLGFGKRRLELQAEGVTDEFRPVLRDYSAEKLNLLLAISSAICILSYMLYTVSAETIAIHGTDRLIYTVPFVIYGVFRYLLTVQEGRHDGPVEVFAADPLFALNAGLWLMTSMLILYW